MVICLEKSLTMDKKWNNNLYYKEAGWIVLKQIATINSNAGCPQITTSIIPLLPTA